jgi:peptidoglycan/LPS O-acetylase OafA/YrhL
MKFRYDIGFLRAFAVLIVVFFHYKVPFFEGGFVGVDIFFVISGYLMTNIILRKFQSNTFNLWDFYKRRFTRIVPALIVMIRGVLATTFFLYFPIDFKQVSQYSLFSSVFLSNYYYLFNSGYFDPSSQSNILLHTWSLSVEWQFYMVYPIFLFLIRKSYLKKEKTFKVVFLSVCFLSFLLVVVFNNFFPPSYTKVSFFSVTHRAWEMMLGGVAFIYSDFFRDRISDFFKKIITYVCFLGLIISVVYFTDNDVWPSLLTLIPVIATFLIIALHNEYVFYKNKKLQYLGSISYSWYLWHWPFYVVSRYFGYENWGITIVVFILSILVSVFSYEIIEKKNILVQKNAVYIITFLVLVFSSFTSFYNLNSFLFNKEAIALTEFNSKYEPTRKKQFNSGVCHHTHNINYKSCLSLDINKKNVLLLGDSHAGQFSLSLRNKLDINEYNFIEHTVVGSFPLINAQGEKTSTNEFRQLLNDFIVSNKNNIDIIIISCNWLNHNSNSGYMSNVQLANGINETIAYIEKLGIKVIILGQTEKYIINFPKKQAFKILGKENKDYINNESLILNNTLKNMVPTKNYIDLFLRSEFNHYDEKNKVPYMFDRNHLTIYGADQVVDYLINKKVI